MFNMKFVVGRVWEVFFLLIVACNLASSTTNVADVMCGRSQKRTARIKNGQDATPGEFPWLVSVKIGDGHFCGGALIHKRFLLTAAHCLNRRRLEDIKVVAGEHNIRKAGSPEKEQVLSVAQIYVHENYTRKYINDICVVELAKDVNWTDSVRPLCLADEEIDGPNGALDKKRVSVAGWGWTDLATNGGKVPDVLQKMEVKVVPRSMCQDWYVQETGRDVTEKGAVILYETHLCAGQEDGFKDSCYGDSGGPLMIRDNAGRLVMVGIVSTGIDCGLPRLPGLYTRVSRYIGWIRTVLKKAGAVGVKKL